MLRLRRESEANSAPQVAGWVKADSGVARHLSTNRFRVHRMCSAGASKPPPPKSSSKRINTQSHHFIFLSIDINSTGRAGHVDSPREGIERLPTGRDQINSVERAPPAKQRFRRA
jgi:hypothetical protein